MAHDPALDELILSIIDQGNVAEQLDLQEQLRLRGYNVPQATLSRRMKKHKIAKVNGIYKCVQYKSLHLPRILRIEVNQAGMIVIHTHPGNASSLASFFDNHYVSNLESGIIGTISGDDTILMILKSQAVIDSALARIKEDFSYAITLLGNLGIE